MHKSGGRLGVIVAAIAALVVPVSGAAGASGDGDSWHWWSHQQTYCYETKKGDVYAKYLVNLHAHNQGAGRHWYTAMRLKARLVPKDGTSAGRSWSQDRYPAHGELMQDRDYAHKLSVFTRQPGDPSVDWVVEVKMIWDRQAPFSDVVKERTFPFRTAHRCLPPAASVTL